ncbi:hypothetical protein H2204_006456 [Knufia peltigerae]|uniref:FAD-binding domain-containing protein n=1 Tax=Knufia peltigerae TaxID=1002370 RepID=A0AA38Y3M4_9EURO|nr:hypothetical protein H2204_006456 [Knufia peltigerae]
MSLDNTNDTTTKQDIKMDDGEEMTTEVIICGCGPTGALLSALLGRKSIPNVVIEREREIVTDPRGIALDEDGIRLLQEIGIYDKVYSKIGEPISHLWFTSGKDGLMTKPFMHVDLSTTHGGSGHVGGICHRQPVMEKYVRQSAIACPASELKLGCTVTRIEETDDHVRVKYTDDSMGGVEKSIKGKFLVGADGKTGFTRKMYLEKRGVVLESVPGYEYQETWVAVNYHMDLPTPETHPDFPLWKLGFTPQDVYDAFFPKNFRFIGNPDRPSVCGTFGLRKERLWRFEYVVDVDMGEDPQEMATYDKMAAVIFPYLTHPGKTYGGWCLERKQQLDKSIASTVANGELTTARNPFKIFVRDWILWFMRLVPSVRRRLELGGRGGPMARYRYVDGMAFLPDLRGGRQLAQGYCKAVSSGSRFVVDADDDVDFTDNVIFRPESTSFLRLLVLVDDLDQLESTRNELNRSKIEQLSNNEVKMEEVCYLIMSPGVGVGDGVDARADVKVSSNNATAVESTNIQTQKRVYRVATGEEFEASGLCDNRPPPVGYDMFRIKTDLEGAKYVLVRPDRFTFAACHSVQELAEACKRIEGVFFSGV